MKTSTRKALGKLVVGISVTEISISRGQTIGCEPGSARFMPVESRSCKELCKDVGERS